MERRRGKKTWKEDVDRCLAAGMDAHVAKPVTLAILHAALEDVLVTAVPASA